MSDWLSNLKAGDEVTVMIGHYSAPKIEKVDRATSTLVMVGNLRFKRKNGYRLGAERWDQMRIVEPTEAHREASERLCLKNRLGAALESPTTTLAVLRAMAAQLQPTGGGQP
jgi:hypothetical protein